MYNFLIITYKLKKQTQIKYDHQIGKTEQQDKIFFIYTFIILFLQQSEARFYKEADIVPFWAKNKPKFVHKKLLTLTRQYIP